MHRNHFLVALAFFALGIALFLPACDKGAPGVAGPTGVSAVPTPYCNNPSSHGITTVGPSSNYSIGGYIYADPITFASSTVGISLSINISPSYPITGQARMAVYTDNGSFRPGNLVVQSDPQFFTSGWNTWSIPNVYLPAGSYWIAYLFSNNSHSTYSTGGVDWYLNNGWDVFPTTASAGTTVGITDSIYISTCP